MTDQDRMKYVQCRHCMAWTDSMKTKGHPDVMNYMLLMGVCPNKLVDCEHITEQKRLSDKLQAELLDDVIQAAQEA